MNKRASTTVTNKRRRLIVYSNESVGRRLFSDSL